MGVNDDRALDVLSRIEEIRIARLRPGDVVLARFSVPLEPEETEHFAEVLGRWFPDNNVVILEGVDIEVVRPGGGQT